jgi:hypothetical protein
MEQENDELQLFWDELSPEAQQVVLAEQERTGESIEVIVNRLLLAEGRRRFPKAT